MGLTGRGAAIGELTALARSVDLIGKTTWRNAFLTKSKDI